MTLTSGRDCAVIGFLLLASAVGAAAQDSRLQPGEAYVTRFSGEAPVEGSQGGYRIDVNGVVGGIINVRAPRKAPRGDHWINEPQRSTVTAGQIGQVFGVALDDAASPNIYLASTAAFGLHLQPGGAQWEPGMWGPGGPGAIYRLDPSNNYQPRLFSTITLNNRSNTGAALGNIAYDAAHKQLFVSDMETGMIHRIRASDGADLGFFDHGVQGRGRFFDAVQGQPRSLAPIPFDPNSSARFSDCPSGDFSRSPECWNLATSGRRIWGLGFRFDQRTKQGRLFYAAWSSPAFGNLAWSQLPEDEKRNSIWSVRIANDGSFDVTDVRREFLVPDFFVKPEDIARAGFSQPVSDISFAQCGDQNVMLLAERGGLRNLGLAAEDAFATPHESRALRFEVDSSGAWRAVGRYDVGFYDRRAEGAPFVRANCSGGVAFGYGYTPQFWSIDRNRPNDTVWITGDSLCSPAGPCIGGQGAQQAGDPSQVHGIQGTPQNAFEAVSMQSGQPAPASKGLLQSYLVDTDNNIGPDGQVSISELMRNDASLTGDIAIYEPCVLTSAQAVPAAPPAPPPFTIRKTQVDAVCPLGQPCTFDITLTNPLATPWSGIPRIVDVMPAGAFAISASPPWACVPDGLRLLCEYPELTLNPNGVIDLRVVVQLPLDLPAGATNCVEGVCIPIITGAPLPPPPPLTPAKRQVETFCTPGDLCNFEITLTNNTGAVWSGSPRVTDQLPPGATPLGASAPWACAPNGAQVTCEYPPVTLNPGEAVTVVITVQLPADLPPGSLNCADGVCIPINTTPPVPPASPPLTPAKAQVEPSCQPGGVCTFNITLTNNTGQVWSGVPNVTDDMPAGASAIAASAPWNCSPNGSQVYCEHPQVTLNPGESLTLTLSAQLPPNLPPGSLNCANGACIPVNVTPPQPPQPPPPPPPPPTDPTPPRTAACEDQVRAGGDAPETIDVPITNRSGTATFRFDTYNKKDRILVYVDGSLTYDSTCVGTNGNKETQFSVPPGSQNVRVEVQPNCEAGTGTGTQWQFQLICPPTQQPPVHQSLPPRPPRVSLPPPPPSRTPIHSPPPVYVEPPIYVAPPVYYPPVYEEPPVYIPPVWLPPVITILPPRPTGCPPGSHHCPPISGGVNILPPTHSHFPPTTGPRGPRTPGIGPHADPIGGPGSGVRGPRTPGVGPTTGPRGPRTPGIAPPADPAGALGSGVRGPRTPGLPPLADGPRGPRTPGLPPQTGRPPLPSGSQLPTLPPAQGGVRQPGLPPMQGGPRQPGLPPQMGRPPLPSGSQLPQRFQPPATGPRGVAPPQQPRFQPPQQQQQPRFQPPRVQQQQPRFQPPRVQPQQPRFQPPRVQQQQPRFQPPRVQQQPRFQPPRVQQQPRFQPPRVQQQPRFQQPRMQAPRAPAPQQRRVCPPGRRC